AWPLLALSGVLRRRPRCTLLPTRRSSDLDQLPGNSAASIPRLARARTVCEALTPDPQYAPTAGEPTTDTSAEAAAGDADPAPSRSEEHTSELQSRENLVCRLLLDKKKTMI